MTAAADVIFTVVTNDDSMRQIFLSPGDSLLANADGKVFINCATLSPGIHAEVEAAAEKAGARPSRDAWPVRSRRRGMARSI